MAAWLHIYDPNEISTGLENAKTVDGKGNVSFQGFSHYDYAVILSSMVILDQKIPGVEKKRIINQASFKAGKKGKITAKSLLAEICKLESEYLNLPIQKYKLITSISINRSCPLKSYRISDCTISFKPHLAINYIKGISRIVNSARHSIVGDIPKNYTLVSVTVSAKSHAEAANTALDALDLLRGIWNFHENRRHGIRISFGKRKPVNKFILGPLHTLHLPNGKLATESWWYDPEYVFAIDPHQPDKEIERLYKFTNSIRNLLKRSNYSKEIISAIIRYSRALDFTNWEDAFLRLWSVLEHLTGTGHRDNYKVTIRRASFIFGGENYSKQVLTHLKDYRNRAVHEGSDNHDIEAFMFQLKRYVEALIAFHIGNSYRFKNISEASIVLDLPCNRDELLKKHKALNYARKFLGFK